MNGGLSKMDHEEMRAAYLRALNHKTVDFMSICNTCKLPHEINTGEIVDVTTSDTIYKIWYCSACSVNSSEYAAV